MKPIRMIALFDYNSFTGYATVSKNLVHNWKKTFGDNLKLDIVAVNYFGEDYTEGDNIRVISAKQKDIRKDDFGRYVFMNWIINGDYDIVFILQDLGVIVPIIPLLEKFKEDKKKANKKQFKSILYFPVDFALTPNLGKGLEFFDCLATYTEYGKTHALRVNPKIKGKLKVIPHGNNMANFFPIDQDEALNFRKEYFGEENAKKYIVGSVNRNQPRKDIPTTIFGFLEYWENTNKDSLLYLHMNPEDPMGWNLRTILSQTPLIEGKDYMFPPEEDYNKGADVSKLNNVYNSIDVYLSTCTGEGWGLTITEAMACKKPIIAPSHTSVEEICNKGERAYMLDTLYPNVAMVDNIIRFQSDIYQIADILDDVHKSLNYNSLVVKDKVDKAFKYVQSLEWKEISKVFSDEIKKLA